MSLKIHVNYHGLNNQAWAKDVKAKGFFQKKGNYQVDITQTLEKISVVVTRAKKPETKYEISKEGSKLSKIKTNLSPNKTFHYEEVLEEMNWKKLKLENLGKLVKKAIWI